MTSQSNNVYFDIIVQRAQEDTLRIRIMTQNIIKREDFFRAIKEDGMMLHLENVFEDEMFFYNPTNGSKHEVLPTTLNFLKDSFSKFTTNLRAPTLNGMLTVECRVKYLGPAKPAKTGSLIRNGIIYQQDTELLITIWHSTLFHLNENKMIYLTHLKVEDFFGIKLATTKLTLAMSSNGDLIDEISKERSEPLRIRALGVAQPSEISVEGIMSASITSTVPCHSKNCDGEILPPSGTGSIGKCSNSECSVRVNLRITPKTISGAITVENGITLSVNPESIDATFGDGVTKMYESSPTDLADKFLEMTNPTILYDRKLMQLISAHSDN